MSTKTRFEKEVKGNSEMAYFPFSSKRNIRLCVCGEGAGGELCWRGEGESGGG